MKTFILLLLIFTTELLFAQTANPNFALIDKRVKSIQADSVGPLSRKLTLPYKTQVEKVRAIFRWITENIQYDVVGYHNPKGIYVDLYRPTISPVDSIRLKDYNDRIIHKVLKERRAVCEGYARLFKTLCDSANVPCVIISGYIRWYFDPIGVMTDRKHSWNAVLLNNKWQLLDPTWATGKVNHDVTEFKKEYDDFYFLTDPIQFFNDHYPTDAKWALFRNPPSEQQFYNFPFFYPDFYKSRITSIKPTNGLIEVSGRNKKINIEIEATDKRKDVLIGEYPYQSDTIAVVVDTLSADNLDKKHAAKYKIDGNRISWDYEIQSLKTQRLDIFYNDKLILSYGIKFRE